MPDPTTISPPTKPASATVECPECGVTLQRGDQAKNHAKGHWLSNPNVNAKDLKGEAQKRFNYLMNA